jgi:xanthine dehydrogenase accessory factor
VDEVLAKADEWREAGEEVAIATVVATRRSAPRPLGSKLAVTSQGRMFGSVSGGCVEAEVAVEAEEVIASGRPKLLRYGIADETAWEVGLPCGGEISVLVAPLDDYVAKRNEAAQHRRAALITFLEEPRLGQMEVVGDHDVARGSNRVAEVDGKPAFVEVLGPPPLLLVLGAVDLAEALCAGAKLLGWRCVVADARGRFATAERLPSADELVVAWPDEALARVGPDEDTAVVVLSHDERFDVPALAGALATDAFYVAALGSRRTQERRHEALRSAGVSDEALARISGPAGLDIGAETPAEIALAILAEAVAARAGRSGG